MRFAVPSSLFGALQAWAKGAQVCLPYGSLAPYEAVKLYGGVYDENTGGERMLLSVSMSAAAPLFERKVEVSS